MAPRPGLLQGLKATFLPGKAGADQPLKPETGRRPTAKSTASAHEIPAETAAGVPGCGRGGQALPLRPDSLWLGSELRGLLGARPSLE